MSNVMKLRNTTPRAKWVERIDNAWREQVTSIFDTGNLLEAAKEEMAHGEFMKMIKEELPFDQSTANRLMKIAECDHLRNSATLPNLPAGWSILHQLSFLSEKQFNAAIENGTIYPKMKMKDAKSLRGIEPKERKKKEIDQRPQSIDDWRKVLTLQISEAASVLSKDDLPKLQKFLNDAAQTIGAA